ncbi:PLP-dependent aminotransferase family protein [Billgrantia desiderata]|uniref:PLP-dependent aminotransferase family protein n=1 Tax=Billgrantia desiderata TaxID=52021 RepID=A0AAW4YSK1_9GAMM|nr:PLP-dependent aminotransferase family protein [Halomonas desiderata]MCE8027760.1 PLP-dependent aminotransferase family protein [Halomonas desiderata]MCE8051320.1 PLP-dependent aminotransferase family protein [Halomonas desiderata]OUE40885.1 GntR family transcriptional regulator [Halomonas desiderata SP1]SEF87266.1 DNA-binding transcriptional regulator, MocR family, contains an aminotransferase domain [Halomonas desiderata]
MTIWVPQLPSEGVRYRVIADAIALAIQAGELAPGQKLPPQRQLADRLGVTVGTVTRAYAEAERQGRVVARVGSGTYVRDNEAPSGQYFLASRPVEEGIIDLSLSLPPPHPLRAASLGRVLQEIAVEGPLLQRAVEYQSDRGVPEHRERLAVWMTELGMPAEAESLLVTQGGQHGISLALQALTRPGERIAADVLTYPGLISAASQAHLKLLGVPMDAHGMDVEALARLCAQQQPPRLVYVTPDQNNPTGTPLSESRRERLAALARRHDFWIVEDGVQYLPATERGTPLYRLAPERTLFIFSTSKVLAGGLRIGTLLAPAMLRERLGAALRAQSWMVPPLMVEAVCRWVASDDSRVLLDWLIEELGARQRLARERLAGYALGGREHGNNLWLPLPEGQRSAILLAALAQRNVLVSSAEPFCVGSEPAPQALRLCLSAAVSREALSQALDTLVELLAEPPTAPWQTL